VPYKYFFVNTDFKEDKWIQRAEARPGAPAVVHHIVVFVLPPGQVFNPEKPGTVLCGTAPGEMPMMLADGWAKKVPRGSRLIFQMHYTPNGKEHKDRSKVALIFAPKPPRHEVMTRPVLNRRFALKVEKIPAGAANHKMEAEI